MLVSVDLPPGFIGGIAAWVDDAATALSEAGEDVTVLSKNTGDTSAFDATRPYRVIRMRGRSWGRHQDLWAALQVGPRLGPGDRLVCATWTIANLLAPLARARGVQVAVAVHGSEVTQLIDAPAALRRLGPDVLWLPVSHFLAGELDRLGGETWNRQVLPMPLGLDAAVSGLPRAGLICVARRTPLKGLTRAARLAAALGLELTVVGDGPEPVPGARLVGRLPRAEARDRLARAQAAVLLPRADSRGLGAEGLGLVLLEAAAAGTPVIGCRTGGVAEAVGPGLVLDDPEAPNISRVRELLDDPGAGAAARQWVCAHHGPDRFVAALEAAWDTV
jgi:glycosyltransferase involved in cell wall biosynthesis